MGLKYSDAPDVSTPFSGAERFGITQSGSSKGIDLDQAVNWGKITTVITGVTITDDGLSTLEVNVGTATITLPDLATWAGRTIKIRKISSSAGTITIQRAGTDTITKSAKTSITLTSESDYWELFAGSNHWEITNGSEVKDGVRRAADGTQVYSAKVSIPSGTGVGIFTNAITYPLAFSAIPDPVVGDAAPSTSSYANRDRIDWITIDDGISTTGATLVAKVTITLGGAIPAYVLFTGRWY